MTKQELEEELFSPAFNIIYEAHLSDLYVSIPEPYRKVYVYLRTKGLSPEEAEEYLLEIKEKI